MVTKQFENVPRDAVVTVGASSTELSPEVGISGQRRVITITNASTGGQVIRITFGKEGDGSIGIILYPTGSWSESIDSAYRPTNLRICAYANAAGGTVNIHERVDNGY